MTAKERDSWIDIVLGALFIVFGILVYAATLDLPGSTYDPLGPAFMPRALGILSAVTAAVILYHGIRKRRAPGGAVEASGEQPKSSLPFTRHPLTALAGMALVFVYILTLDIGLSGFRTLTVIFVLFLGGMLIKAEKSGKILKKGVFLFLLALALSFGLFYLFTQVFIVDLY